MSQDRYAAAVPMTSAYEIQQNSVETRTSFVSNDGSSSGTYYDGDDMDRSGALQPLMFDDEQDCIKKRSGVHRAARSGYRSHVPCLPRLPWNIHNDMNDTLCISTTATKRAHSSTGWLDGLRGVACLMVVFHHSNIMFEPFDPVNPTRNVLFLSIKWFVTLPFWKIWYAGSSMIAIFFVISGFSLSFSSFGYSRKQCHGKALQSLSSSTFRRWMRLHIPALVVSFADMLASYAGLYNGTGLNDRHRQPPKWDKFSMQFWDWWAFWRQLSNPFQVVFPTYPALYYVTSYDPNLWTIPIEYQGSMVVFVVILALASVRRNVRLAFLAGIVWLMFLDNELNIVLFLGGTLLADMHYAREELKDKLIGGIMPELVSSSPACHRSPMKRCKRHVANIAHFFTVTIIGRSILNLFWTANFIVAIYNISKGETSIDYLTAFSAIHLVFTIDNAKFLQSIFTTRLAKYLGKISFSLYLVHGTFLHTLGWHLWTVYTSKWIGDNTAWQHLTATTVAAVPVYIVSIFVAHFVSWALDDKSVQFARWLFNKLKA